MTTGSQSHGCWGQMLFTNTPEKVAAQSPGVRTDNRNVPGGAFVTDDNIGATDKVPRRRVAHHVILGFAPLQSVCFFRLTCHVVFGSKYCFQMSKFRLFIEIHE